MRRTGDTLATRPSARLARSVVQLLVRVAAHRLPAGDHPLAVLGRLEALVRGDRQEVDGRPLERVDVPLEDARPELGDVGGERAAEGRQRRPVGGRLARGIERVGAGEQGLEAGDRRRRAGRRVIGQAVVEPRVADRGRVERIRLEIGLPVLGREPVKGSRGRHPLHAGHAIGRLPGWNHPRVSGWRHSCASRCAGATTHARARPATPPAWCPRPRPMTGQRRHSPTSTPPVRPIAGPMRTATLVGVSA